MPMTKDNARQIASQYKIPLSANFHTLNSEVVDRILEAAKLVKYRRPKYANGSTARYFFNALQRAADSND